jgi:hypothetical protein
MLTVKRFSLCVYRIVLISGFRFVTQLYTYYIKADVECYWEHILFNVVGILNQ